MRKLFEVWALSAGGRFEIVALFKNRDAAHREAARIRCAYKRVFVDYGFYS